MDNMHASGAEGMFMSGTISLVQNGKPVSGADIIAFDQTRTTDENGIAQFEHVLSGTSHAKIIYQGKEYTQELNVSSPHISVSLTGKGEVYIPSNESNPSFGQAAISQKAATDKANSYGLSILVAGFIAGLLVMVILLKYALPKLFRLLLSSPKIQRISAVIASLIAIVAVAGWLLYQSRITTNTTQAINFNSSTRAATNNTLRTPTDLKSYPDDRVAILTWDAGSTSPRTRNEMLREDKSRGIYGYYIEWGKESLGFSSATKMITEYRWAQLQPLENGVNYIARIYAIDKDGNVSTPSQTISFVGNSSRVDALRTQMNGFFDDFNRTQGSFDELKWNMSFSGCVGEGLGGQFINSQYHAHNDASATNCDRGMSISRPRKKLNFKDRTATIVFDLDGAAGSRTKWYLDILGVTSDVTADKPIDVTSRIADNTGDVAHPGNIVRIRQENGKLEVLVVDQTGEASLIPFTNDCASFNNTSIQLDYCKSIENNVPLETTPNFRRKWKVELSKTKITIYIDGGKVYEASLVTNKTPQGLPYDSAYLHWLLFTYNTPKENRPIELIHWDNFGFDAPANDPQLAVKTHNYTDGLVGTKVVDGRSLPHTEAQANPPKLLNVTIPIPDQIKDKNGNNPIAAKLVFTLQGYDHQSFEWQASNNVTINGTKYLIPQPTTATRTTQLVADYAPYTMVLPIDPAALKTGDNNLIYTIQRSGVFNIHIELDYPISSAPDYTQPNQIFPNYDQAVIPKIADIGPAVYIDNINNVVTWDKIEHDAEGNSNSFIGNFSGNIAIDYAAYSHPSEVGNGKNNGIKYVELLVDRAIKETDNTSAQVPVADYESTFNFDTTQLCNGRHEIFVRAFNGNGSASIPDYFQQVTYQGQYYPLFINTNNPGKPACSGTYIPVATPIPYLTPRAPAPTDEHQPGPVNKSISLIMYEQNNSGQQGTVTFKDVSGTSTEVSISVAAQGLSNQPAHIHTGTCANPGEIIFTLTNLNGGQSITTVNQNYNLLFGKGYIVNVHKSTTESGTYTSCTQIVDPAIPTPTPTTTSTPVVTAVPTAILSVTLAPSVTGSITNSPIPTVSGSIRNTPTGVPTISGNTTIPPTCPTHNKGDANCDGKINLVDYEIFIRELITGKKVRADFDSNGVLDSVDDGIWRNSYL